MFRAYVSSLGCARVCMRFLGLSCLSFWFLVSGLTCSCLVFSLFAFHACCLFGCFVSVLFLLSFFELVLILLALLMAYSGRSSFFLFVLLMSAACFLSFCLTLCWSAFCAACLPFLFLLVGLSSSLLFFSVPLSLSSLSPLLCLASPHAK